MANKPHVHQELIKAWADGAEIEVYNVKEGWITTGNSPIWSPFNTYRIKPQEETKYLSVSFERCHVPQRCADNVCVKFINGEIVSIDLIKPLP